MSKKQHIVVFNSETNELLIDIPLHDMNKSIAMSGVEFSFYDGTEPVFMEKDGLVTVKHNSCMIRMEDIKDE